MASDTKELFAAILQGVSKAVGDGSTEVTALIRHNAWSIANLTEMLVKMRATGSLKDNDERYEVRLGQLQKLIDSMAQVVVSRMLITLEKAWNAVVGAVWKVINTELSAFGLPAVAIPGAPAP